MMIPSMKNFSLSKLVKMGSGRWGGKALKGTYVSTNLGILLYLTEVHTTYVFKTLAPGMKIIIKREGYAPEKLSAYFYY